MSQRVIIFKPRKIELDAIGSWLLFYLLSKVGLLGFYQSQLASNSKLPSVIETERDREIEGERKRVHLAR